MFIQQAMIEYKESKFNSKASFYASQGEMCLRINLGKEVRKDKCLSDIDK